MPALVRSPGVVAALGLAMLVLEGSALAAQSFDALHANLVFTLAEGVAYIAAVALLLRGAPVSLPVVLALALAFRLMVLFAAPFHSTDIYRYVWDGKVQGAGINPYLHVPNDPALAALRDAAIWPRINRADYAPTIYPPMAQALFFMVTRVSASVTGMKLALVALEGVTAWAILRLLDMAGLPRSRLLVYAWSPLVIWEVAGAGHVDAAMTAFVAFAVLARVRDRDGFAGLALGAAVLIKFLPIVILPAVWRRWNWTLPAAVVAMLVIGYLPYLGAGWKVLGFLPSYAGEEGLRDGTGFWIARLVGRLTGRPIPPILFVCATGLVMGVLAIAITVKIDERARPIVGSLVLAAAGMVALSPVYPWYFVWLVPFLCFVPSPPLLWLTAGGALLYWDDARTVPWMRDVLFGGAGVLAAAMLVGRFAPTRSGSR
ncbi:glycosyltransferase 87 family protein [Lichenifustis flavocetrariae]|uniref:glycosyltransferase 87 family protein n=1 Tax=Lichenifustis flavocetrariae TaxID=2949735 RepID=UPI0024A73E81|nr:glycosyltransferase 87 family protein [Lichenifustis flavocetrariae]